MDKVVIGVDPASTKLAAVLLRDDAYEIHVVKIKPKAMPDRIMVAYRWIRDIVRAEIVPVVVYVELPMLAAARGGANALMPLGQIQGALVAGAIVAGATVVQVYQQVWKKEIVGAGNAGKLKIKLHVRRTWPAFYLDSEGDIDVIDASQIALYGKKREAAKSREGRHAGSKPLGGGGHSPVRSPGVHSKPGTILAKTAQNKKSKSLKKA